MKSGNVIVGSVVKGLGKAKKLGFPTLNLRPIIAAGAPQKKLSHGIFAVFVFVGKNIFMGAMYCGPRMFHKAENVLEVHLIARSGQKIPRIPARTKITVAVVRKIRSPKNFKTEAALVSAISGDILKARKILKIPL